MKWDPSNSKDVSQVGYTGTVYLDAYELDGTLLCRIDLGVNIRAGAHYTQFPVYDFDGDGRAELMVKTAPGHPGDPYDAGRHRSAQRYVTDRRGTTCAAGVPHTDDYRMSRRRTTTSTSWTCSSGWSTHPEVVAGDWPATLEEAWGIDAR